MPKWADPVEINTSSKEKYNLEISHREDTLINYPLRLTL